MQLKLFKLCFKNALVNIWHLNEIFKKPTNVNICKIRKLKVWKASLHNLWELQVKGKHFKDFIGSKRTSLFKEWTPLLKIFVSSIISKGGIFRNVYQHHNWQLHRRSRFLVLFCNAVRRWKSSFDYVPWIRIFPLSFFHSL